MAGLQLSNNKFINGILGGGGLNYKKIYLKMGGGGGGGGGYTWPALDVKGIVTERRKHYTVL